MINIFFVGFVILMTGVVLVQSTRYLGIRTAFATAASLVPWLIYVGWISYTGVVRNLSRPPGTVLIVLPAVAILILLFWRLQSPAGVTAVLAFPLWVILGTQFFRVGVELFLHELWTAGIVPKMLTFEGANFDVYVGGTAPLIAWLSTRGRLGLKAALVWNVFGVVILANVVGRAILTTPALHAIHTEVPNLMFGTFPFTFIPGFFVPLAITLHLLAFISIRRRLRPAARTAS